jgi:hypothetical protein
MPLSVKHRRRPNLKKLLSLILLFSIGLILTSCNYNMESCELYSTKLQALTNLSDAFHSNTGLLSIYPTIWAIIITRKIFFI